MSLYLHACIGDPSKMPYKKDCFTIYSQSVFGSRVIHIPWTSAVTSSLDFTYALSSTLTNSALCLSNHLSITSLSTMSLDLIVLGNRLSSSTSQNHSLYHMTSDATQISSCPELTPHNKFTLVLKYQFDKISLEFFCCHIIACTSKPLCVIFVLMGSATHSFLGKET